MAVCASLVHFAIPRSTNDTAALRDVNFFSRFSIEMFWDTDAMKTRLPGGQTIVQPSPDLHLSQVSRQLINSERSGFRGRALYGQWSYGPVTEHLWDAICHTPFNPRN
jgi:hypothetical protein